MNTCWTSNKPINGLRHFVLVNEIKDKDQITFLMVSVLDDEISLIISQEDLMNKSLWIEGWLNLPQCVSITKAYKEYKLRKNKKDETKRVFINDNSFFNIY